MPVDSFNDDTTRCRRSGVRTMAPPGDHDVDTELVAEMTYVAGEFPMLRPKAKPHFDMSGGKNFTVSVYI